MNKDRKKELDTLLNTNLEEEKDGKENKEEIDEKSKDDEIKKSETETKENKNEDEEEDGKNDEKEKSKEDDEEDESDKGTEDHENEDGDEEDKEDEASDKKDKWHGKSREEVIRMYEELDGKPLTKIKSPNSEDKKSKDKEDENLGDGVNVPSDEELSKMTPRQFAEWMVVTVRNMVSNTYDTRSQMRDSVTQEIREAQKDHPLLKTSPEYRELVLSLIDTASQKGTVISLKDACAKVDEFAGKVKGETKVTDIEKIRLKKAKAQVERGAGAPTSPGEDKGAEERRLEEIFGTSGSKGPLGGLGV